MSLCFSPALSELRRVWPKDLDGKARTRRRSSSRSGCFGTRRYLVLYALSGLLGSAASLWWNPMVNSVGASGALFGVLGATFVFMLDKKNGVPVSIMSAHATSMGVFILYGLYNGFSKSGIDNAAHLGGLAAGLALGFALATPFGAGTRPPAVRAGAGVAACVAAIVALALLTPNTRQAWDAEVNFAGVLTRLVQEEQSLVDRTRETLTQVQKAAVTQAEAGRAIAGIAGHWNELRARLVAYPLAPNSRFLQTRQDLVEYADLRQRALARLARALSSPRGRQRRHRGIHPADEAGRRRYRAHHGAHEERKTTVAPEGMKT